MTEHFQQLFTYDDWANRESAASVERAVAPPEKARKVLAHIIGTQWLWYARMRGTESGGTKSGGTKSKMAIWPELSPAACAAESKLLLAAWRELLASGDLNQPVHYKNTKGEPWSSTAGEILTHVAMHGAYHRGQIATLLRDSGNEPAYTDYIHAVRNRLL